MLAQCVDTPFFPKFRFPAPLQLTQLLFLPTAQSKSALELLGAVRNEQRGDLFGPRSKIFLFESAFRNTENHIAKDCINFKRRKRRNSMFKGVLSNVISNHVDGHQNKFLFLCKVGSSQLMLG